LIDFAGIQSTGAPLARVYFIRKMLRLLFTYFSLCDLFLL